MAKAGIAETKNERDWRRDMLSFLWDEYPEGTRVQLIKKVVPDIPDDFSLFREKSVAAGTEGSVMCINNNGTICVVWDNGVITSLVHAVDKFKIL